MRSRNLCSAWQRGQSCDATMPRPPARSGYQTDRQTPERTIDLVRLTCGAKGTRTPGLLHAMRLWCAPGKVWKRLEGPLTSRMSAWGSPVWSRPVGTVATRSVTSQFMIIARPADRTCFTTCRNICRSASAGSGTVYGVGSIKYRRQSPISAWGSRPDACARTAIYPPPLAASDHPAETAADGLAAASRTLGATACGAHARLGAEARRTTAGTWLSGPKAWLSLLER
jgi:hypothetical protein